MAPPRTQTYPIRRFILLLTLLSTCAALPAFAQNPDRPIRPLGEFSNMRFTEEHAYGYAVDLWRDGDSLIGLLLVAEGPPGDTPTGILENVKFDPRTGRLSFTAKLSTASAVLPGGRQEPTRDLFEFTGTLKASTLAGTFQRSDPKQPSSAAKAERAQLKIQRGADLIPAASYTQWKREVDEILKLRGPRW